jgi:short-subunit dehydrogenase
MEKLEGKKVLLTGGSRGIGPIIAEYLTDNRSIVAIAARSSSNLQEVAAHLNKKGHSIAVFAVDLKDSSQREQLVTDVLNRFGTIDILINNAGLGTEGYSMTKASRDTVGSPDYFSISPKSLYEETSTHLLNLVVPGLTLLPRQSQ